MHNIRFELHLGHSGDYWEVRMCYTITLLAGDLNMTHLVKECDTRMQAAALAKKLDEIFNG